MSSSPYPSAPRNRAETRAARRLAKRFGGYQKALQHLRSVQGPGTPHPGPSTAYALTPLDHRDIGPGTLVEYLRRRGFDDPQQLIRDFALSIDPQRIRIRIPLQRSFSVDGIYSTRALFDSAPCNACGHLVHSRDVTKRKHVARRGGSLQSMQWASCPECHASAGDSGLGWLAGQWPKYLKPLGHENTELYNGDVRLTSELRATADALYLVEGYSDVWSLHTAGQALVGAYSSVLLNRQQAQQAVHLARQAGKAITLVPDADSTGLAQVIRNSNMLRRADPGIAVNVVVGIEHLTYVDEQGRMAPCKDIGEVLLHHGVDMVREVLTANTITIDEYALRRLFPRDEDGDLTTSRKTQIKQAARIIQDANQPERLSELVGLLAREWTVSAEEAGRFISRQRGIAEAQAEAVTVPAALSNRGE